MTVTLFDPNKPISQQDIEEMAELWSRHNVVIEKKNRSTAARVTIMILKILVYVAIGAAGLYFAEMVPPFHRTILIGAGVLEGMFLVRYIMGYLPPIKIK
jgi:hypothetical protein